MQCTLLCSASAVEFQWNQIPEKGHQLSSCSLTAASIFFFCPDIDCSCDVLTFALNQACSGKGLLIRHPFKTAPTSDLLLCLNIYPVHPITVHEGAVCIRLV